MTWRPTRLGCVEPAVLESEDPVATVDQTGIVGDHQYAASLPCRDLPEQRQHLTTARGIQIGRGLVGEEEVGVSMAPPLPSTWDSGLCVGVVRAMIAAVIAGKQHIVGRETFQIARNPVSCTLVSAGAPPQKASSRAPFAARFESVGAVVPEQRLSTRDLMARVKTRVRVDLEGITGIRSRRVCTEGEDSYTLSVEAALECLRHSAHEAADLEMIICCSISKFKDGLNFLYEPPLSLYVKEAIGARNAVAFDIANACAGMLTGVFIVNDFIRRGVDQPGDGDLG